MLFKPLPIGYENFQKLRSEDYYYVDKTLFIKELLDKKAMVNLFTRPRRFGKTLTLSMLQYFFEDAYDFKGNHEDYRSLFDGLKIMDAGERYTKHMAQYPVISLTLKSGKQSTFENSMELLRTNLADEFRRHRYLLKSEDLPEDDKEIFVKYMREEYEPCQYKDSLKFLSRCLKMASGKEVIVLLDEYDVPLEGAYQYGYYDQMIDFIRELFASTVKTNNSLYFAVITGCLRISKESIFTGLNNLDINSIMSTSYGEYFGFTEAEVQKACADYQLEDKYQELKEWYNGYYFGEANVYNPWSTILYLRDHAIKKDAFPVSYWANTSSNSIVRTLIDKADREVKDEIESLIAGGSIEKPVHEDITYAEINESMDNLWNFMFFTGYFKKVEERFENRVCFVTMRIPNQEVLYIFENKIRGWFQEQLKKRNPQKLFDAVVSKDTESMKEEINTMLYTSISFHDYYENFYHGFLAGVLYGMENYVVKSNRESGNGRTDLWLKPVSRSMTAYLFEFKIADSEEELERKAKEALTQIDEKKYDQEPLKDGYKKIVKYGVAFYGKDCFVAAQQ
mgnify:CR=1 FL=1